MPWGANDVARFNRNAAGTARGREVWLKAANATYGSCVRRGRGEKVCAANGVMAGNAAVKGSGAQEAARQCRTVQALLFPVGRFSKVQAVAWAESHGFKSDGVVEPANGAFVHLHQRPGSDFRPKTYRTWTLQAGSGILVRGGQLIGAKLTAGREMGDAGLLREEGVLLSEVTFTDVSDRIDREAFIIKEVAVLGPNSKNGRYGRRDYSKTVIKEALPLFETRVFANHPKKGDRNPRDVKEMVGRLRDARQDESGKALADLHLSKSHGWVMDLAEVAGDLFGLSINANGDIEALPREKRERVNRISACDSVDVVSTPAANRNLFEAGNQEEHGMGVEWGDITADALKSNRPDLVEEIVAPHKAEVAEAVEKVKALEGLDKRRGEVDKALADSGLPAKAVTEVFRGQLLDAKDDEAVKALIEDRKALVGTGKSDGKDKDKGGTKKTVTEGKGPKADEKDPLKEGDDSGEESELTVDTVVGAFTG